MRVVELEQVDFSGGGHTRRVAPGVAHALHIRAIHRPRRLAARRVGQRGRREQRPRPCAERPIQAACPWLRRAAAPGVPQLEGDARAALRVRLLHRACPSRLMLRLIEAGAVERDAPLGRHRHRRGQDQRSAGPRAMHQPRDLLLADQAVRIRAASFERHRDPIG